MPPEQRSSIRMNMLITRIIAVLVMLVGLLVMYGWFAGIPLLTSLSPTWVSMKFVTAICFVLSGAALFLMSTLSKSTSHFELTVLPIIAFVILLFMGGLVPAVITGAGFGIETFLVSDIADANFTTTSGVPAIATIVCFIALGLLALLVTHRPTHAHQYCLYVGIIVSVIGSIVLVGYATGILLLQSYMRGISTAMAFHTAILFILLGGALLLLAREFPVGTEITSPKT